MNDAPAPIVARVSDWPAAARGAFWSCRALFLAAARAADVGTLDESLKWGQPAWRPVRPRTGSTLRLCWSGRSPEKMEIFVDCKTDLAARMQTLYPDDLANDGRRGLAFDLKAALPERALSHLAQMTFTYHRRS